VNAFFIPLKVLSNFYTYNGLSSHLPLWFGYGAIVNILFMILAMQVPVRGICCGSCSKGKTFNEMAMFIRKYHAYYFVFGVTNDWWYHATETTPAHMSGMVNSLLIFWQMICMYTPAHRNKWWCIACEFIVILHAPLMALEKGYGSGFYGFGFTVLFLCSG